jgi:Sulfotransferase family
MDIWPNLFIVGAPKAGTSSLYSYLCDIPGIYMSPVKEPNYFSINVIPDNHRIRPIRDKQKYLHLFQKAKDAKILGEASSTYLSDPETPKLIHQVSPHAHIIISLRDPVDRAFSQYLMMVRSGETKLSFYEELQKSFRHDTYDGKPYLRLDFGLYYESTNRYLELFGADHVAILIFEELISNVKEKVETILHSLRINYSLNNFQGESHNSFGIPRARMAQYILGNEKIKRFAELTVSPRYRRILREKILLKKTSKPKMEREAKEFLVNFYSDDVQTLQKALGRKLPWPNFSN